VVEEPDHAADDEEGGRGERHEVEVLVGVGMEGGGVKREGDDAEVEQGAEAEEFADDGDTEEDEGIACGGAKAVKEGGKRLYCACHALGSSHDKAVGDDEADENGKRFRNFVAVGAEKLIDDDDEEGDDGELGDHAHAIWCVIADEGDKKGGKSSDKDYGDAHGQGNGDFDCNGKCGTDAKYGNEDLVFFPNLGEKVGEGSFSQALPLLCARG